MTPGFMPAQSNPYSSAPRGPEIPIYNMPAQRNPYSNTPLGPRIPFPAPCSRSPSINPPTPPIRSAPASAPTPALNPVFSTRHTPAPAFEPRAASAPPVVFRGPDIVYRDITPNLMVRGDTPFGLIGRRSLFDPVFNYGDIRREQDKRIEAEKKLKELQEQKEKEKEELKEIEKQKEKEKNDLEAVNKKINELEEIIKNLKKKESARKKHRKLKN